MKGGDAIWESATCWKGARFGTLPKPTFSPGFGPYLTEPFRSWSRRPPIDFGLRSYSTQPQIWGGDPNCSHHLEDGPARRPMTGGTGETSARQLRNNGSQFGNAWVDNGKSHQRIRNGQGAHGLQDHGADNRSPALDANVTLHPSQGATCTLCGAWRGELGSEPDVRMFVDHLVEVFREVKRVLRPDGTCWLNIGDSMAGSHGPSTVPGLSKSTERDGVNHTGLRRYPVDIPAKNLLLTPWRLALALQDDGWIVRSVICWAKRAPMPESVQDRPTSAWEPIFLLSKQPHYYFDSDAVREPHADDWHARASTWRNGDAKQQQRGDTYHGFTDAGRPFTNKPNPAGRNQRNVWECPGDELSDFWKLSPEPYKNAHFATYPTELPRRCILAGSRPGDLILDPFSGAGTTVLVANRLGRRGLGLELNPDYAQMARDRIQNDAPLVHAINEATPPPPAQPSLFGGQP